MDAEIIHASSHADGEHPSQACLLVVDDRPDDLEIARIMLSHVGKLECRFLTARDGVEALAMLGKDRVDVMLVDINMPVMDGFELLERLRVEHPDRRVAVIMCTGSTLEDDRERARSLGAHGYLLKPPRFDDLREMLEQMSNVTLRPNNGRLHLLRATGTR